MSLDRQLFFLDLGTSEVRIFDADKKLVVQEPPMILQDTKTDEVLSMGADIRDIEGKNLPSARVVHAITDGCIADAHVFSKLLQHWMPSLDITLYSQFVRPKPIVAVSGVVTTVHEQAIATVFREAGFASPEFVPSMLGVGAAAAGSLQKARMFMDIGAGKVDIGIVCRGELVASAQHWVAGRELERRILTYCRSEKGVEIAWHDARMLKHTLITIGTPTDQVAVVRGKQRDSGKPVSLKLKQSEFTVVTTSFATQLKLLAQSLLFQLPSSFVDDVVTGGITIIGGGALIRGIDTYLSQALGIPVVCAPRPTSVIVLSLSSWYSKNADQSRSL